MSKRRSPSRTTATHHARAVSHTANGSRRWFLAATVALYVATPLIPSESPAAELGTGIPLAMLWLVLALAYLVGALLGGRIEGRFGWTDLALILLVAWQSISAILMIGQGTPRAVINMTWQWVALGIGFVTVRQLVRSTVECKAICSVMIGLALCLSTQAYHQYFISVPRDRAHYDRDPEQALAKAGIAAPRGSPERTHFEQRLRSTEPTATFTLANSLAGFVAPWLVVAIGIAVATGVSTHGARRVWLAVGCSAVPIAGCLVLTKSRSGYVATALGVVLVVLCCRSPGGRVGWKIPVVGAVGLTLLVIGAVVTGAIDVPVLSEAPKSLLYRLQYWQATAKMIGEYPWFGCGPGNFQDFYTGYMLPEASETVADPHNFLMEIWATAGTPALVALLGVMGSFAWQVTRSHPCTCTGEPASGPLTTARSSQSAKSEKRKAPLATVTTNRSVLFVFGGAVAGVALAFVLGWLVGFRPGWVIVWLGLPMAAVCAVLLTPWVDDGYIPVSLLATGVAVLLVNLLAAGGISFPGVAGSLWLLMALALNLVDCDRPPVVLSRSVGAVMIIVVLVLAAVCHQTAYHPVLRGHVLHEQAVDAKWLERFCGGVENVHRLPELTDPYSPLPWMYVASIRHGQWLASSAQEGFEPFEQAKDQLLRLSGRSSRAYRQVGMWYLWAFRKSGSDRQVRAAIRAYRRALELHPNSNILHAELAWSHHLAGNREEAAQEAAEALRLDDRNPHRELRLAQRTLFDEVSDQGSLGNSPLAPGTRTAKQWMTELRIASSQNKALFENSH